MRDSSERCSERCHSLGAPEQLLPHSIGDVVADPVIDGPRYVTINERPYG